MVPAERAYCRTGCTPAAAVSCEVDTYCAAGAAGYTCGAVAGKKNFYKKLKEHLASAADLYNTCTVQEESNLS